MLGGQDHALDVQVPRHNGHLCIALLAVIIQIIPMVFQRLNGMWQHTISSEPAHEHIGSRLHGDVMIVGTRKQVAAAASV